MVDFEKGWRLLTEGSSSQSHSAMDVRWLHFFFCLKKIKYCRWAMTFDAVGNEINIYVFLRWHLLTVIEWHV